MRRGPLADNPIDVLLAEAARERTNGVLKLHCNVDGLVYLVDGEIYLAEALKASRRSTNDSSRGPAQ